MPVAAGLMSVDGSVAKAANRHGSASAPAPELMGPTIHSVEHEPSSRAASPLPSAFPVAPKHLLSNAVKLSATASALESELKTFEQMFVAKHGRPPATNEVEAVEKIADAAHRLVAINRLEQLQAELMHEPAAFIKSMPLLNGGGGGNGGGGYGGVDGSAAIMRELAAIRASVQSDQQSRRAAMDGLASQVAQQGRAIEQLREESGSPRLGGEKSHRRHGHREGSGNGDKGEKNHRRTSTKPQANGTATSAPPEAALLRWQKDDDDARGTLLARQSSARLTQAQAVLTRMESKVP